MTNAYQALQASGTFIQTSSFPLALASIDGTLRQGQKSSFKSTISKTSPEMFTSRSTISETNSCVIVDFMYYTHKPPPDSVQTFSE